MVCLGADANAGHAAYDKSCKSCHGPDGTPNPSIAKMMKVDMKDLKSADVQALSDADIKAIIVNAKGKMPKASAVTGSAVDDVVAFVRSLKK
jgi:mono/diheme cytochrome c family protein